MKKRFGIWLISMTCLLMPLSAGCSKGEDKADQKVPEVGVEEPPLGGESSNK